MRPAGEVYRPYGAAERLFACRAEEVLLSGPAGTGKSRACLAKLDVCARKYPGMRGLIVRRSRVSLTESALVTFEDRVLPPGSRIAAGAGRANRHSYVYPNGSEIVVGGMDRASRIMSTEFDLAYWQEAIEGDPEGWEAVTTRLRHGAMPYQQLIADTNPWTPAHWLKARCDAGGCLLLESRHQDNPLLWDREREEWTERGRVYIGRLDRLTGPRKARLRYGRWVQAEGQVYEGWDRAVHVVGSLPPQARTWRRLRCVDFGYTNPFVCLWLAVDPDGRVWVYRQLYGCGRLVEDWAKDILRLSVGEDVEATVCDHDAEDRATLRRHLVATRPACKRIREGIGLVAERLKVAGDGKPRLYVVAGSLVQRDAELAAEQPGRPVSLEQEFEAYVWPRSEGGEVRREVPVDADNHALDALRYGIAWVDGLGRKVVRVG